jgi:DNA-binding CsgD family transcriptional regulator
MTRLDKSECARLMELTSALCSIEEGERLQPLVLNSLQALIPHELGACHRMQPARHEIAAFYEPRRRPLPAMHEEFWRLTEAHPLNTVLFTHPARAWKLSDVISRRAFHRTELYNVLYRPLGVDCELTAVLADDKGPGTFFLISLHRHGANFSERDRAVLNLVLPHVAHAQRRLHARTGTNANWLADEELFYDWLRDHTRWDLSHRETDVLFWLCQGKTNDEIGGILGIAGRTAETHALRVYPKIGVENRYAAIATLHQLATQERSKIQAPTSR